MLFDTVCVVGVGLIGGSFGLAMRERKLARQVIGAVRREETINAAFQRGAVDNATTDLAEAARGADLVLVASPVGQMKAICEQLGPVVRAGAIVTDAGSTKDDVVAGCSKCFGQKAFFVGGHPMAGSERTGVEAARSNLFENAIWVLTPTADTPEPVVTKLVAMIEGLGATPLLLNAAIHDSLLAVTSHLPHLTAAALVHLFSDAHSEYEVAQQLIAGGWRDSTRVAAGSSEMWRDICLSNTAALTKSLDDLLEQLHQLRHMLQEKDADKLYDWFESASTVRRKQGYFPRSTQ
ncbi:MAG: prephenate dehydrogenase/arogenate dehydrogenase family protein [Abitibacteriaceae bacterium]|nr:prephenate dehydrogenase/arogenate dehydrogenase family protein [Abditibacteriaceae bacterium]